MGIYVRRDKKEGGRTYYYLVSSDRYGKKVVQRRLEYLGAHPTPKEIAEAKVRVTKLLKTGTDRHTSDRGISRVAESRSQSKIVGN